MDSNPLFKPDKTCKTEEEFFDKRFHRLYDSDINSDCEFLVGNEKIVFKGHKLIFSTASPVFYAIFYGNLKEDSVVVLSDLAPEGFKKMKQYIYTGEVEFQTYIQIIWTLFIGKKYSIPTLVTKCMEFLRDGTDTYCLEALRFYEYLNDRSVTDCNQLFQKIVEEKTFNILSDDSFLSAKRKTVGWILSLESLALTSELELFNFFEKWALALFAKAKRMNISCDRMGKVYNHLKQHIRFLTMTPKEFAEAAKSPLLTEGEKLAIALNIAELGSTPYPNYLSSNTRKRYFRGTPFARNFRNITSLPNFIKIIIYFLFVVYRLISSYCLVHE
ncbi:BTB/POZ domain-containing protein 6-like isoform X1 [Nilaparvata lugens]|uniref:BTB/POZ domain-containing protein 6-like isoform X1 n=1 Tax=Nilaparvata lugens TaxID=108931 RepID=UPI00193D8081|nr:BTB/POZ domain-containing protein 6-like isoform X1 [Nilaparvata lugens]